MKIHTISLLVGVGISALLSPVLIVASEKALTLKALERGYEARIAYYDSEIASTTKALDEFSQPKSACGTPKCKKELSLARAEALQIHTNLSVYLVDLRDEKNSTEAAYHLLVESLR